jgi:hypothetical protein
MPPVAAEHQQVNMMMTMHSRTQENQQGKKQKFTCYSQQQMKHTAACVPCLFNKVLLLDKWPVNTYINQMQSSSVACSLITDTSLNTLQHA